MSPNPDAADEELPFKEGQIIKVQNSTVLLSKYLVCQQLKPAVHQVYGDKDTDGFYKGHLRGRTGLIPCNMVSEIRAEDEETLDQLLKQGFLPLSTPVDRIGMPCSPWGRGLRTFPLTFHLCLVSEQSRRGLRRDQASRRMVALYDYDPRESSPNVDVEVLYMHAHARTLNGEPTV